MGDFLQQSLLVRYVTSVYWSITTLTTPASYENFRIQQVLRKLLRINSSCRDDQVFEKPISKAQLQATIEQVKMSGVKLKTQGLEVSKLGYVCTGLSGTTISMFCCGPSLFFQVLVRLNRCVFFTVAAGNKAVEVESLDCLGETLTHRISDFIHTSHTS
ncbi:Uncharacterized protein Fot_21812 [Forsythia ovata]|uniref:Uncharacterized protein n=1 Tax=Forsythia ovata TaxID=205694 RepID=A0ABD1UVX3_9LAMI